MTASTSLFLREFLRAFHTTGAALPSGKRLARALTDPIDALESPRRILEAGPGTGPFTDRLVRKLRPGDELTLCEINPTFANHLGERLETDPGWVPVKDRVRIVQGDVRETLAEGTYHAVISGLPLNNFDPDFVGSLLDAFLGALVPGGVHTFFEYLGIRELRMRFDPSRERLRLREVDRRIKQALEGREWSRTPIYANAPPAWAYRVEGRG